jgi:3,4-dihydroxy 2-butanone 4-phosphate synthase/GTP cyclohydrolase II
MGEVLSQSIFIDPEVMCFRVYFFYTRGRKMKLNKVGSVIKDIKAGRMVIVVDDESRENEGDLIVSAERITAEKVNFMAKYGRGLFCVPMEDDIAEGLGLHLMSDAPQDPYKTAWAVSVDA